MKSLIRLIAVQFVLVSCCFAETGTVTFYSAGFPFKDQFKTAVTLKGIIPFSGWVFDGGQVLAHAEAGHFMTFHIPTGSHSFSVSYNRKHPGKTALIQLDIESGHNYCVRLSAKYANYVFVPVSNVNALIDQVDCRTAFHEAGDLKPLEIKRIENSSQTMLDTSNKFPNTD